MAQFNLGSNTSTAATPNFGFGAKTVTPTFGGLGASQPTGSITFGTPIASTAPTPQNTGLNFGSPAPNFNFGTPQASTAQTGISFGQQQQQKPTGIAFGTPQTPASTPAPNFSLNFGGAATSATSTPASQGLSFGTPASSAPSGGFTLGGTPAQTPGQLGTGLGSFGTPASSAAQPSLGLSFGAPSSTATPGLNFGTPSSTSAPGLNFGAPSSAATGLSLGSTTTTATLGFGTTTTASTGLNFGAPTSTPANFGFGALGSSLGKVQKTQGPTLSSTLNVSQAPSIGLGGIDTSQNKTGTVTTGGQNQPAAKENLAPNEILQSIENFKTFVKEQKAHSSDVSRGSARPFLKVGEDIDTLISLTCEVGNELQRNQQVAVKLKNDSAKCLHDAEMAQRTYDTPPGLQFENIAPMQYFVDLVNKFEQDLQAIRMQIDITDKHVQSLQEPRFLTSQELSVGMKKLHETFVALAGRLQSVHTQVESHKEQYLNLRRYILKDPTNIFQKPIKEIKNIEAALQSFNNNSQSGPTPFSSLGMPGISMMMPPQQIENKPPPAYPGNTNLSFGNTTQMPSTNILSSTVALGANTSLFGNSTQLGQSTDNSNFQLQSPPPGNKRGKR